MRVFLVIALLAGAAFIILLALTDLVRDLLRHSHQASPDLQDCDAPPGRGVAPEISIKSIP